MTKDESKLIADTLQQRIIEITKMFQAPDWRIPKEQIPRAMKVQFAVLARDLDRAFAKRDPEFDRIFVKTVRAEMHRSVNAS